MSREKVDLGMAYSAVCAAITRLQEAVELLLDFRGALEEARGPWSPGDIAQRQAMALRDLEAVVKRQQDTLDQLAQRVAFLERSVPHEVVTAKPEYGPGDATGRPWPAETPGVSP